MPAFFIVNVTFPTWSERSLYDEYIDKVKPIVESHGGEYLVRSEQVSSFADSLAPDRIIIIRFESRAQLEDCFSSTEYKSIQSLRESSVQTQAYIVEQD